MARSLTSIRVPKPRTALGLLFLAMGYVMVVNVNNQQQKADLLADHLSMRRDLMSEALEDGSCSITPTEDADPAPADAKHSLLASYPGSGKRFTWTVIKALTNREISDDWNYSEKLEADPLTVKTSWPHKEGKWSWGNQMDQVILLIRNPRWAIPSYHNMRFELDYAEDEARSLTRVPYTYSNRPAVALWENWRDAHFDVEITRWVNFIDFWMSGGGTPIHDRCLYSDIKCKPVAVIDFDLFYKVNAIAEFYELRDALEASLEGTNAEMVQTSIRQCVFEKVFTTPELHQGNRTQNVLPPQYKFTITQLGHMLGNTTAIRDKYAAAPYDTDPIAINLVHALGEYVFQIAAEYSDEIKEAAAEAAN